MPCHDVENMRTEANPEAKITDRQVIIIETRALSYCVCTELSFSHRYCTPVLPTWTVSQIYLLLELARFVHALQNLHCRERTSSHNCMSYTIET